MKTIDLLITGGTVVTENAERRIIPDGAIAILGDTIIAVAPADEVKLAYSAKRTIDASGRFIFPGLINTHTHLFQTFIKGLGEGLSLYEWVDSIAAPSSVALNDHEAYLSAIIGGLEALRSGTTTVLDFMYSMPKTNLYRAVAQAFGDLKLRGILGIGLMETGEVHGLSPCQFRPVEEALAEWDRITTELANPRLSFALAPEIAFGISRTGLEQIRQFATEHKMPITIHINEVPDDDSAILADHGMRCVPFLESLHFWGPDVLAVHCVNMQPEDMEIFIRHQVKISYNPVSNMYLGVGMAPIREMLDAGITVSLATDGAGSNNSQDMLEALKCAALLMKTAKKNPAAVRALEVLDMATIDGAKAIGQSHRLGSLEIGKQADLFILDPLRPKTVPVLDPVATLVYSAGEDSVVTTIVAGQVLLDEGKITPVNEKKLLKESQKAAFDLATRIGILPKV
jgi:5-methylthioadenosine/S-adenosylhomocysteine deaminase